jgi:NitT/TauT family transport system permease protein
MTVRPRSWRSLIIPHSLGGAAQGPHHQSPVHQLSVRALATFLELLQDTPRQAGILTHTWFTVFATIIGFTAAMVLGIAIAAALWWWNDLYKVLDPYLVVANAMPKTAFVPIFYIWLGATLSISRHVARDLALHRHSDDLQRVPGHRSEQDQARADIRRHQRQVLTKVVLPEAFDLDRGAQGECGTLAGRRRGRRVQSANIGLGFLIQYGSQIFKLNIVMTAITILAIVSSVMYLAISRLEAAVMAWRRSPHERSDMAQPMSGPGAAAVAHPGYTTR